MTQWRIPHFYASFNKGVNVVIDHNIDFLVGRLNFNSDCVESVLRFTRIPEMRSSSYVCTLLLKLSTLEVRGSWHHHGT